MDIAAIDLRRSEVFIKLKRIKVYHVTIMFDNLIICHQKTPFKK